MIALSVRQPWAHAIVHLGKRIENRVWQTDFRGRFLVHAGKSPGRTLGEFSDNCEALRDILDDEIAWGAFRDAHLGIRSFRGEALFIPRESLPLGGIVGAATLAWIAEPTSDAGEHRRWHAPDQFGFVLEDVRAVPFVRYVGALGLFRVADDVAAKLRSAAAPKELA